MTKNNIAVIVDILFFADLYLRGESVMDKERNRFNRTWKHGGKYISYVWPGGYPVYYVDIDKFLHSFSFCASKSSGFS